MSLYLIHNISVRVDLSGKTCYMPNENLLERRKRSFVVACRLDVSSLKPTTMA